MDVSRLSEHPLRDIYRAVEEDGMIIYRKICEVVGFVVDITYHNKKFWKYEGGGGGGGGGGSYFTWH